MCQHVTGMNHAKTVEPIEMAFGMWVRVALVTKGNGQFWGRQTWACRRSVYKGAWILRQKLALLGRGVVHGNQHDED